MEATEDVARKEPTGREQSAVDCREDRGEEGPDEEQAPILTKVLDGNHRDDLILRFDPGHLDAGEGGECDGNGADREIDEPRGDRGAARDGRGAGSEGFSGELLRCE